MAKHTCPSCGHQYETVSRARNPEVKTEIRDGVTWYSHGVVNYTTGAKELWCTFRPSKKDWRRPEIRKLAKLRAEGMLRPGVDWLPEYLRKGTL